MAGLSPRSLPLLAALLVALAALVSGVPTTPAAAPALDASSPIAAAAAAAPSTGEAVKLIERTYHPFTPPPPSPPPNSSEACLSHDVYLAVLEAVTLAENVTLTGDADLATRDQVTQIVVLSILGVLSLALLLFGATFLTAALSITIFLTTFWFVFGLTDNLSYEDDTLASFSMCVLPMVLAVLCGVLGAVLAVCMVTKVKWLSYFLLGVCVGGVAMYLIRDIIIDTDPSLEGNKVFAWYWFATAAVACITGLLAAWMKTLIYHVATVLVGAYGIATFVVGMVPVCGGPALGSGSFVAVFFAASAMGAFVQYVMAKKAKPDEKMDPLVRK
jgi:hypothetical protein